MKKSYVLGLLAVALCFIIFYQNFDFNNSFSNEDLYVLNFKERFRQDFDGKNLKHLEETKLSISDAISEIYNFRTEGEVQHQMQLHDSFISKFMQKNKSLLSTENKIVCLKRSQAHQILREYELSPVIRSLANHYDNYLNLIKTVNKIKTLFYFSIFSQPYLDEIKQSGISIKNRNNLTLYINAASRDYKNSGFYNEIYAFAIELYGFRAKELKLSVKHQNCYTLELK